MKEGYDTFTMIWSDCEIVLSHQANWLNSGQWHIELRCDDRLPVTESGYHSIFVLAVGFADEGEIIAFVSGMLDEAALSPTWRAYLEDSQQLKLF